MMNCNIHRAEPSHREAANGAVARCGDRAILLIDKVYQIKGHEVFHELHLIKTVAPLAGFPTSSIPIRKNYNQIRYLSISDERISRLCRFAASDPVVLVTRRPMKQIEGRIPSQRRSCILIGWWQINQE